MRGKNYGVCHSCRQEGHFFSDCPNKRPCPLCKHAFLKLFEIEKNNKNKGELFETCSVKCGYWEWVKKKTIGAESSARTSVEELSCLFEASCRVNVENDTEIAINVTIRKRGDSVTVLDNNGK